MVDTRHVLVKGQPEASLEPLGACTIENDGRADR